MDLTADVLRYYISISIDYHQRRVAFFDWWHKITLFTGIVLGSGAAVAFIGEFGYTLSAVIAALLIAVCNALDLVYGVSTKARQHADLRRRFVDLETALEKNPDCEEHLRHIQAVRNDIEADEPPTKKMVVQLAANAYYYANGFTDSEVPIPFWKRKLAHIVDYELPRPTLEQHT